MFNYVINCPYRHVTYQKSLNSMQQSDSKMANSLKAMSRRRAAMSFEFARQAFPKSLALNVFDNLAWFSRFNTLPQTHICVCGIGKVNVKLRDSVRNTPTVFN